MTEQEFYQWLGAKIKEFRKAAKMNQEEVAEKAGIYQQDLSKFENRGERIKSAYTIKALIEATGHTMEDVFTSKKKATSSRLTLTVTPN